MSRFNLDSYEPVEDRLARFWSEHPDGAVRTELCPSEKGEWVVFASVFKHRDHPHPDGTGYAHEVTGEGMVNKTSALENCETSAIGRALANLGYAPKGARPSREEMAKVNRRNGAESHGEARSAPKQEQPEVDIKRLLQLIGTEGLQAEAIPAFLGLPPDTKKVTPEILKWAAEQDEPPKDIELALATEIIGAHKEFANV